MLNIFARRLPLKCFSLLARTQFWTGNTASPDFKRLKEEFVKHKDMVIFNEVIKGSNSVVDNINYFSIYKILDETKADLKHYQDFYQQLDTMVEKKSDNIRVLMAKMKGFIAKQQESKGNYYEALTSLEQGMEVLEYSLIPPILVYYQLFRTYGFIQYKLNNRKEALESLEESVKMIEQVLQHSQDRVNNDINCKNQSKAYALLADLDPEKEGEWVEKCFDSWKEYEGDKFQLPEYAESIIAKGRLMYKTSPEKADEFLTVHAYQFEKPELKEYVKAKKAEIFSKQ